jgi:hypothetical protein
MGSGWPGMARVAGSRHVRRMAGAAISTMTAVAMISALAAFFASAPLSRAEPQQADSSLGATSLAGSSYGASHTQMKSAATAAAWPQQDSQWCGIATVAAIARYQGSTTATQTGVANYLNSDAAVSVWGTPARAAGYWGPGFRADISRDFGTDPRSLTIGLVWAAGGQYHQFIAAADAYDASVRLARDLERSKQPISVFVDHGLHSVVVSAVFSTTDPMVDASGITGFEVWDPAWDIPNTGIQTNEYEDVPLNTWLGSTNYWGLPYSVNTMNGYTYDPDPAVGPYLYDPSIAGHAATLWSGHYVYIRPDPPNVRSSRASVDWAFNQNGQLVKGFSNEFSPAYRGSTAVWEGAKNTLASTSAFSPAFSARAAYDPSAAGSAPAAALVWTGTDSSSHLNIRTTQDGLLYSSTTTLAATSIAAPATLVAPPASTGGQNIVLVAWDGTDSAHSLNVLYDVYNVTGQTQSVTLSYGSQSAPSLTWFGGQVWLAWTDTASAHTINILPMGPQGITPGTLIALTSEPGASGGPTLSVDAQTDSLVLSWAQTGTNLVTYRVSTDGAQWTKPAGASLSNTAVDGASIVTATATIPTTGPEYYIASRYLVWTAPGGDIIARPLGTKMEPGLAQLLPARSPFAPVTSYLGGPSFIFVWTGTDSAHHINVAFAQM